MGSLSYYIYGIEDDDNPLRQVHYSFTGGSVGIETEITAMKTNMVIGPPIRKAKVIYTNIDSVRDYFDDSENKVAHEVDHTVLYQNPYKLLHNSAERKNLSKIIDPMTKRNFTCVPANAGPICEIIKESFECLEHSWICDPEKLSKLRNNNVRTIFINILSLID